MSGTGSNGFGRADYVKITVFGFALAALWNSLHGIILPLRLLDFVPEPAKNTYLGILTFSGLLLAIAVQPIAGMLSDRCGFQWGRRRPFILIGTTAMVLLIPGLGLFASYAAIFAVYVLLQVSGNTAQGPYQALIPDLVPENRRGLAAGVKSLLEIAGGISLVWLMGYLMGRYASGEGSGWMWLALGVLAAVLLAALAATALTVREQPAGGGRMRLALSDLYGCFRIDVRAHSDFVLFLISRLLVFMALATLQTFTLYYLKDVAGMADPASAAANLLIVVGIGMLAAVYPAGYLSDIAGRRPVAAIAGLLGAGGILVLFFAPGYGYILLGGAILGTGTGGFMSSNWALATDLVEKGEEARYLGLTNLATAGGAALARLIGPVIDWLNGYATNLGYQAMLGACFVYFIAGSALLMKIRARR